jgi:hypothetical protein
MATAPICTSLMAAYSPLHACADTVHSSCMPKSVLAPGTHVPSCALSSQRLLLGAGVDLRLAHTMRLRFIILPRRISSSYGVFPKNLL